MTSGGTDLLERNDTDLDTVFEEEFKEAIPCGSPAHNGPLSDSAYDIRDASNHDPEADAAFLAICSHCDRQLPLCAKKVSVMRSHKGHYSLCLSCRQKTPIEETTFLPL